MLSSEGVEEKFIVPMKADKIVTEFAEQSYVDGNVLYIWEINVLILLKLTTFIPR